MFWDNPKLETQTEILRGEEGGQEDELVKVFALVRCREAIFLQFQMWNLSVSSSQATWKL